MRTLFEMGYALLGGGCALLALAALIGLGVVVYEGNLGDVPWFAGAVAVGIGGVYLVERSRFTLPIASRHGRRFRLRGTPEEVRTRLGELSRLDDAAEGRLKAALKAFGWGCLPLILAGASGIWAANAGETWFPLARGIALLLVVAALGLWLYAVALRLLFGRHDLDDGKLATVQSVLDLLGPDLAGHRTLALDVSMGSPAFGVRRVENGFGRLLEVYDDRWFHLCARLQDGSDLRVTLRGSGRRRVKFKRKRKRTAVRVGPARLRNEMRLTLRVDPRRHPGVAGLADPAARGVLPRGLTPAQVTAFHATDTEIRANTRDHWDPATGQGVLLPLVWLYHELNAPRR